MIQTVIIIKITNIVKPVNKGHSKERPLYTVSLYSEIHLPTRLEKNSQVKGNLTKNIRLGRLKHFFFPTFSKHTFNIKEV